MGRPEEHAMRRSRIGALFLAGLLAGANAPADGLFRDIYRGLDLFATPSGAPVSAS